VYLHEGDHQKGGVLAEARRFASPPIAVSPSGKHAFREGRALVDVAPAEVTLLGVHAAETGRGTVARVLNASPSVTKARLRPAVLAKETLLVDPLENEQSALSLDDGAVELSLGPWQIATVLFRT
jgi:alpha-mannosidase